MYVVCVCVGFVAAMLTAVLVTFGNFQQLLSIPSVNPFRAALPLSPQFHCVDGGGGRCLEAKKKEDGAGCGWFLVDPLLYVRTNTTNVHSSIWSVDTFIAQTSRELVG